MRLVFLATLGCVLAAAACRAPAATDAGAAAPERAAGLPDPAIPDGLHGFSGTLAGTVRQVGDLGFTIETESVVNTWRGSTASDPQSAVGKVLLVNVQWEQAPEGAWRPFPGHVRWVSTLRAGDRVQIEVRNDEAERLHILELNADQRRAAGNR